MGLVSPVGHSSRRRKTLTSNLHCLVAYPLKGKASRVNPEEKSGDGVPMAVHCWFQWCSGNSCNTVGAKLYQLLLFLWIHQQCGEGGSAAWVTACPPYHPALACTLERSFQSCIAVWKLHGRQQVTGYKPQCLIGVERGARGCFWRWERFHWIATARLKLGSLQPLWVHGD